MDVIDCVESLEVLMSIDNDGCSGADPSELSMFRVAVEFNHLHYLVSETEEDQLVQDMLPVCYDAAICHYFIRVL